MISCILYHYEIIHFYINQYQVFGISSLNSPPSCGPDPCGSTNLNRGPNDLPFIPSAGTQQCFQLGQVSFVQKDSLYILSFYFQY